LEFYNTIISIIYRRRIMKKKSLVIFLINIIFILILIFFNTFITKVSSLLSISNLIIFCIGVILSFIVSKIIGYVKTPHPMKEKDTSQTLREKLLSFIDEIEQMSIDTNTLQSAYINSIKLFQSIITDKDTNTIIERHFRSIVDSEIRRASRYGLKFGILILKIHKPEKYIDIKNIVKNITTISRKILRIVDIIGRYQDGLIYLLPQTDLNGTIRAGERILEEIKKLNLKEFGKLKVSIGVSAFPYHGKNYEILIKTAEKNIRQAELLGGDQVIFSPG